MGWLTYRLWLPVMLVVVVLLSVFLSDNLVESKHLRGLESEERFLLADDDLTVCVTAEQCKQKFTSMNSGGSFYIGDYTTKGCYAFDSNLYFGTKGTTEQMGDTENLPSNHERIYCNSEPIGFKWITESEAPSTKPTTISAAPSISSWPTTASPTDPPTTAWPSYSPTTDNPTYSPTLAP